MKIFDSMKCDYRSLAAMLLSLLGFSTACDEIIEGGGVCMYGTPNADYKVSGKVNDKDGKPVEGIRVATEWERKAEESNFAIRRDTVYTDANGHYSSAFKDFPNLKKVTVTFEDIDGEKNGAFEKTSKTEDQFKHKGSSDSWYMGEYSATVDMTLEEKK